MTKEVAAPASYVPSGRSSSPGTRRNFGEADKKRILEEAGREGRSVSGVAKKYGIAAPVVFRWRKQLSPVTEPTILPVVLSDAPAEGAEAFQGDAAALPAPAPVIVERSAPAIEIELVGGRRVRFGRDVDPEVMHRLVTLLEGSA